MVIQLSQFTDCPSNHLHPGAGAWMAHAMPANNIPKILTGDPGKSSLASNIEPALQEASSSQHQMFSFTHYFTQFHQTSTPWNFAPYIIPRPKSVCSCCLSVQQRWTPFWQWGYFISGVAGVNDTTNLDSAHGQKLPNKLATAIKNM